jgi:hypothetical protein
MNQIKLLREELTTAQETAAAATGHAKQYEMLAKSSDEAVKAMQVRTLPEMLRSCCKGCLPQWVEDCLGCALESEHRACAACFSHC